MNDLETRVWPWLLLITLVAIAVRLPYWDVIPGAFDEVEQTSFAYQIANGQIRPLTGNDAYAGPFYFYLVAGLIKFGAKDPMIGRLVVLVAGILTVPITYGWVAALGRKKIAALIAASFVALNPDLIVINSHVGGTTLLLPFLSTLFLFCLSCAVSRDSTGWLLGAGVAAGLALQSNLIAALAVAGGLIWFLWQTRRMPRLGKWWPFWPIALGGIALVVFSPVIIFNIANEFGSVTALETKPYIWEHNPSIATTTNNIRRFWLQSGRQTSGVLTGDEDFATLAGVPLVYLALMITGLIYTTFRVSTQPLLILAPFALVMPIISSHYGFGNIGRFTSLLIPVWGATIAFLLAAVVDRVRGMEAGRSRTLAAGLLLALATLLVIYPITTVTRFYRMANASGVSGRALLELSRYPAANNRGEPVYLSEIEQLSYIRGMPYVPHAAFLLGDVYHEFLPPQEIIGRLYANPGPAYFLINDQDAKTIGEIVPLERVDIPANREYAPVGYGLYRYSGETPLPKPDIVLDEADVPAVSGPVTDFGGGVRLLGCETPQPVIAGDMITLNCYWQAVGQMPPHRYVTFAHLVTPDGSALISQDDHTLGQERYPLAAWRSREVVRETYTLAIPAGTAPGDYRIALGIYTWPDLNRLPVPGNADNMVVLPAVRIEQRGE